MNDVDKLKRLIIEALEANQPSNKQLKRDVKQQGSSVVHEDDSIKVLKINNREAFGAYARGTLWSQDDQAYQYASNKGTEPVHMVIDKRGPSDNKRYAYDHSVGSYWDEKGRAHTPAQMREKFPSLELSHGTP